MESNLTCIASQVSLSVCSEHGRDNHLGRVIHSLVIKIGLEGVTPVCNALIAMYNTRFTGNCMMEDAYKCFNSLVLKDSLLEFYVNWIFTAWFER